MELINTQKGKIVEQLKVALLSHFPIAYLPTNDLGLLHDILYSEETHGAIIPRIQCKGGTMSSPELICLEADSFFETNATTTASISDNYIFNPTFKIDDIKIPSIIVVSINDWKNAPSGLMEFVKAYVGVKYGKGYLKQEKVEIVRRSICIVTTPTGQSIPSEFLPYVKKISIPALSDDEIRSLVCEKILKTGVDISKLDYSFVNQIVVSLRGFSRAKIHNLFDEIIASQHIEIGKINENGVLSTIRAEKKAMMEDSPGLKWENVGNVRAAGLESITNWLEQRKEIFADPNKAAQKNIDIPNGLLISGIPGSGKSLMAKTAASLLKLPLISLDMGALLGGIMGQSEHNMIEALHMAEQMAPCVLWIDEIEKAFSGSSQGASAGDSGVGRRMFGKFLTWMQEKSSACFAIATSNDISSLPPELFRSERFDRKFFTFMPKARECALIFSEIIKKENKQYRETIALLPKVKASKVPQLIFDKEAENPVFWLEVINTACAESHFSEQLEARQKASASDEQNPEEIYGWRDNRQPNCKLMTGADISALIKEIKFQLYSTHSGSTSLGASLYTAPSIRYTAIDIMSSPNFKPYGETNVNDIAKCFFKLYDNQFVSASGDCILDFGSYEGSSHLYHHNPDSSNFTERYDRVLYYVIVGAINQYIGRE